MFGSQIGLYHGEVPHDGVLGDASCRDRGVVQRLQAGEELVGAPSARRVALDSGLRGVGEAVGGDLPARIDHLPGSAVHLADREPLHLDAECQFSEELRFVTDGRDCLGNQDVQLLLLAFAVRHPEAGNIERGVPVVVIDEPGARDQTVRQQLRDPLSRNGLAGTDCGKRQRIDRARDVARVSFAYLVSRCLRVGGVRVRRPASSRAGGTGTCRRVRWFAAPVSGRQAAARRR